MNQALNVNQTDQNDWPKKTWEQCPIKVIQTATRVKLSDSLSSKSTLMSIHTYYTLFL